MVPPDGSIGCEIGVADQGSDMQRSVGLLDDRIEPCVVDIYEMGRAFDLQLHQIKQIGSARDQTGTGPLRECLDRRGHGPDPVIGERGHARLPRASRIAATILG